MLVPVALQIALADFITAGTCRSHIRKITRLYRARRDRLVQALAAETRHRLAVDCPAGGMQLMARCDPGTDDIALSKKLGQTGVTARPSQTCSFTSRASAACFSVLPPGTTPRSMPAHG